MIVCDNLFRRKPKKTSQIKRPQRLGVKKFLVGDETAAIEHFEKALNLAKSYDEMPEILIHTSAAVSGLAFDKTKAYRFWDGYFFDEVKNGLMKRPELSGEFKNSEIFQKIISQ